MGRRCGDRGTGTDQSGPARSVPEPARPRAHPGRWAGPIRFPASCCYRRDGIACPHVSPGAHAPASGAVDDFIRHLASRQFSSATRRIRRHFLDEYLQHAQEAAGTIQITAGELMDGERAAAWLADAAAGKTRTRNTRRGPDAAAYPNSMRVRIDSFNAFAEFLGEPDRLDRQPPARGYQLTPGDTEALLHDLTVKRPDPRQRDDRAAHRRRRRARRRHRPRRPRARATSTSARCTWTGTSRAPTSTASPCPLTPGDRAHPHPLARRPRVDRRRARGQRPGHLWIPTKPGRARGGVPVGQARASARAAVRTLHASHRTLVSQLLGTPLRPGALRDHGGIR